MVFDFRSIRIDEYGIPEMPSFMLKTLSGDTICPVIYYGLEATFRYNDVSEFTFTVSATIEKEDGSIIPNPCYDEIHGMRLIDAGAYGVFILTNPSISDDGIQVEKSCTAYSLEYSLNYNMLPAFEDECMMLADPTGLSTEDLMSVVLEHAPNWSLKYVSPSLGTRYRTFSGGSESVYSFLMNTVQETYQCIILYDTRERGIYIYDMDEAVTQTNIFLDRENVIESRSSEELSDEIVTCLSVYGADDVSIRPVNVLASDCIYDLSYFIEIGDIPAELGAKWKQWEEKCTIYQKVFSDLYTQYYNKQLLYNTQNSYLVDLQGEYSAMEAVMDTYRTDATGDHKTEITELTKEMAAKKDEIDKQTAIVGNTETIIEESQAQMKEITKLCSFKENFTDEELKVLQCYFKADSIQDTTYAVDIVAESPTALNKVDSNNPYKFIISAGNLYRSNDYTELTKDEWDKLALDGEQKATLQNIVNGLTNSYLGHEFYQINSGYVTVNSSDGKFVLSGTVVNSTLSRNDSVNADGTYDATICFSINKPTYNGDSISYTNAMLVVTGCVKDFLYHHNVSTSNTDSMEFVVTSGTLTLTADSSINQRVNVLQDLYEYGKTCLAKVSSPAYEFSIESANFLFAQDYSDHYRENFALGRACYLEWKDGKYISPIFLEAIIKYDDWPELTLKLSDKIYYNSAATTLADYIGQTAQTTASLDASKFSFNAFVNSGIKNDVDDLINGVLDIAKKNVLNSVNQDILMDAQGIHLRKYDSRSGYFDPGEVRLTNGQIVFTNDSWNSASLAIGKLEMPDGSATMGVVGQSLIGEILIGKKLIIEATNPDDKFNSEVTHFRVDSGGVKMANGSLYIQGTDPHNQIIVDPTYGIMAGDNSLFKMNDSQFELNILDENGDMTYDPELFEKFGLKIPTGAKFYFDINTGNLAFRGDIYAENGYFNGALKATSLDCTDAKITGLKVGENGVEMSPNATISWNNLPAGVVNSNEVTVITQNAIKTGDVVIGGWIWDYVSDADAKSGTKQRLLGVNNSNNLQIGTIAENANYFKMRFYAPEVMQFYPDGQYADESYTLQLGATHSYLWSDLTMKKGDIYMYSSYDVKDTDGSVKYAKKDHAHTGYYSSGSSMICQSIRPHTDGLYGCGLPSYRWSNIYCENAEINTSDRKLKKNIESVSDKYISLFDRITPVSYKLINGDRTHIGFVSQEVEEKMAEVGLSDLDFGGFCKDTIKDSDGNEIERYGLRYSEFIGIMAAKIKQLEEKIVLLEKRS